MSAQPQHASPPPVFSSAPEQEGESFAVYLARRLRVQGFTPGTFPEAAALEAASDAVLTYSDGRSAVIVCIVDREQSSSRVFGLDVTALERIGRDCLKYTGRISGTKQPLGLQVIEVGGAALTEVDRERLHALRLGFFSRVHLHAMHVDTHGKAVWASTLRRAKVSQGYLRGLVSAPRVMAEDEDVAEPPERKPWLTHVFLAAMALAFLAEQLLRLGAKGEGLLAPGVQTLVALGGVNAGLVVAGGQWWRLLTAPLLHGDLFHLLFNGVCLGVVGQTLESLVGRAWLGLLLLVGALGGGALSMAVNDASVVSVGASGVVTALLGALLAMSLRYPSGPERTQLQVMSIQMLLPSLMPVAMTRTGGAIDFAAHLGGALAGGAVGLVLAQVWSRKEPEPPARRPLLVLGWVALAALLLSVGSAWRYRQTFELELALIPAETLPVTPEDGMRRAEDLLSRYPRDPRARLFHALALADAGKLSDAEAELRGALAEEAILENFFRGSRLSLLLHEELASVLARQGREREARAVIAPFCTPDEDGRLSPNLTRLGLCTAAP
ncbi:rhomboid family intramembrane serine protease [Comamonas sp. JC664]|uniref:rhomboid family intramembrane serine protease n=1 Tax=Comamonas sp. JC664 TaxID=2801917 RepID=UPI00174EB3E4|nr:rhomboid family intramembrane serine protease [Comamonas sp. JC664]MBL0695117.1 rhomboid family intramembrane serine protease [Comamonas sp. JC664]GHG86275.1 hypothetical protein GCM10012319_43080 [Comamonas sp. KCTC 72670]